MSKNELIRLMGLYKGKTKDGQTILSGTLRGTDLKILVMPNKFKQSDNHPDFQVLLTKNVKQEAPTLEEQNDLDTVVDIIAE